MKALLNTAAKATASAALPWRHAADLSRGAAS